PGGWDRKARCASCCVPTEFKTNGQPAVDRDPVIALRVQPFEVLLARDPGVHGDGRLRVPRRGFGEAPDGAA
ncbi:MAG: hypothetical protein OXI01_11040, partial [Albidovulum sp.]|nr:hypothetical protein [Albidovulum sp.]